MITITIYPLQGIEIAGVGPLNLGQSRASVEGLLGGPDGQGSDEERAVYAEYECRMAYDADDQIEFIEFFSGPFPQRIRLSLNGIDPFTAGAENLVQLLIEKNDGIRRCSKKSSQNRATFG
jgi:hypothetical protein